MTQPEPLLDPAIFSAGFKWNVRRPSKPPEALSDLRYVLLDSSLAQKHAGLHVPRIC